MTEAEYIEAIKEVAGMFRSFAYGLHMAGQMPAETDDEVRLNFELSAKARIWEAAADHVEGILD